jgi:hypothetical protein
VLLYMLVNRLSFVYSHIFNDPGTHHTSHTIRFTRILLPLNQYRIQPILRAGLRRHRPPGPAPTTTTSQLNFFMLSSHLNQLSLTSTSRSTTPPDPTKTALPPSQVRSQDLKMRDRPIFYLQKLMLTIIDRPCLPKYLLLSSSNYPP